MDVGTLRNWEQGRRDPEGPASVLLEVAYRRPDVVWSVVRERRARHGKSPDAGRAENEQHED